MANTTNLNLEKPLDTDQALISVINSNSDKIDAYAGSTNQAIQTLSATKIVNDDSITSEESLISLVQSKIGTGATHGVLLFTCNGILPTDMATTVDGTSVGTYGNGLVEANGYYQTLYYRDTAGNIFTAQKAHNANAWGTWHALALKSDIITYVVDEPAVSDSGDATKTFNVGAGLYLILVRGNASTASTVPTIEITDNSGVKAVQGGATGGNVSIHKLVSFGGNSTITVKVTNFTGSGTYNNYSRITILRLGNG